MSATTASTSSPPTSSGARCSPTCTPHPSVRANHARFVLLDPRAETFYADWDRAARETGAILRSAAGRDPYDRDLSDLVGGLATRSKAFRTHWAAHNVRFHATAVKHFHHPVVGELSLSFNRLDIAADRGLTLFTYAAEPGSRSEDALNLLGSWAATIDLTEPAGRTTTAEPRARTRCRPAGVRPGVVLSKRLDTCVGMRRRRGRAAAFAFLRPCRTPSPRYRNASELR